MCPRGPKQSKKVIADLRRPHRQVDSPAAPRSREKLVRRGRAEKKLKLSQLGEKIAGDLGLGAGFHFSEVLTLLGTSDRSYSFHPGPNRPVWVSLGAVGPPPFSTL